jgi:hypothetical protein
LDFLVWPGNSAGPLNLLNDTRQVRRFFQTMKLPQLKPVLLTQFDDSKFKKTAPAIWRERGDGKTPPPR